MIIIYLLIHRCIYFFGCIYLRLKLIGHRIMHTFILTKEC